MLTCDQTITPAKKARVCNISFSALRPMSTTNSSDFCNHKEKTKRMIKPQVRCKITQHPITHLPKPRQYSIEQNCRVHQYSHKLMKEMEVAERKNVASGDSSSKIHSSSSSSS